jgi:hypothetical protein
VFVVLVVVVDVVVTGGAVVVVVSAAQPAFATRDLHADASSSCLMSVLATFRAHFAYAFWLDAGQHSARAAAIASSSG